MINTSESTVSFTETVSLNAIIWIESLPISDLGPSTRIIEDLEPLAKKNGYQFNRVTITSKKHLIQTLRSIKVACEEGLRPILHFDMHGSQEDGLQIARSGEHVSWNDLAAENREINMATENNLCCVFATCFALNFARQVSLLKPSPFYLLIAPEQEVTSGFLERKTNVFYRILVTTGDITRAFTQAFIGEMNALGCQEIFMLGMIEYVRTVATGKAKQKKKETLLTDGLKELGISNPTPKLLKVARKVVKGGILPNQKLIDGIASKFLISRPALFSYEDIEKLISNGFQS